MTQGSSRKINIYKSLEEYCASPITHDEWKILESIRTDCEKVAKRHSTLRLLSGLLGVGAGIFYLVLITLAGLPMDPAGDYWYLQMPTILIALGGLVAYMRLERRSFSEFLLKSDCSITIGGVKYLSDRGVRTRTNEDLAKSYQSLKPVSLGWNRSNLRPQVEKLLRNVDAQRRPFLAFEVELLARLNR